MTQTGRRQRSTAEWVSFASAAAVVATLVGLLVVLWIRGPGEPPGFEVDFTHTRGRDHLVVATVENTGGDTAENVQVVAELTVDREVVADGEQIIDFLSGGESEEVVFVFDEARDGTVAVRVVSYRVP